MKIDSSDNQPSQSSRRDLLGRVARLMAGVSLGATALRSGPSGALDSLDPSTWSQIARYNNYYEFSPNKKVVWKLAEAFEPLPWSLHIGGEVRKPIVLKYEDLLGNFAQENRTYRMRCVEGWSKIVPWQGIPLANLIKQLEPTPRARFVRFTSVIRPEQMIGQRQRVLYWPYQEALRIDEASHPLSILATGIYGQPLPAQNGAPLRLVVPWKYGYKSAKAIVAIDFVEEQPVSSWQKASSTEYGFYANVNPEVPHPRWSQRREIRLGEMRKRRTLMFNGYADQVASLYKGQDINQLF